jgi:hypothetical protein
MIGPTSTCVSGPSGNRRCPGHPLRSWKPWHGVVGHSEVNTPFVIFGEIGRRTTPPHHSWISSRSASLQSSRTPSARWSCRTTASHAPLAVCRCCQVSSEGRNEHPARAEGTAITLRQLASHGFSIGRMDEAIGALTAIFGDSFRDELASSQERLSEDEGREASPIIADLLATPGCLDRLLRVRHILVHEQPREKRTQRYSAEDIPRFLLHAGHFVTALDWVLVAAQHGSVPRTQSAMNVQAGQERSKAQDELAVLRRGTAADFLDPKTPLAELEHHWDRFCELSARVRAGYTSEAHPGTMAPLLYATEMTRLICWRIEDLKEQRSRLERHF